MADRKKEPSEEFLDALVTAGSAVVDCGFCGITHYATDEPGSFEEGELESLQAKREQAPQRFVEHESYPRWGYIGSKRAVIGCPCKIIRDYEDLFWKSRRLISKYLANRAASIRKIAEAETQTAERLRESIDATS